MKQSIMQADKICYLTQRMDNLHQHHIYGGSRRPASDKWGCWVYLTADVHTIGAGSVHNNTELSDQLKQTCQRRFEELYGHDKFMQVFGKNYL